MKRRHVLQPRLAAALGALGLLLAACSSPAATAPTTQTSSPAPAAATERPASAETAAPETTGRPQFAPTAVCAQLRDDLVRQYAYDVTLTEAQVQDPQTGASGPSCRLGISGSAAELGPFLDVAEKLRTLFTSQGWSEDQSYLADGPTGTASAYRKGDVLARATVDWQPAPEASCPADQPISGCDLTPEQQLLKITLDLTQQ
jgi:hypothetical protein